MYKGFIDKYILNTYKEKKRYQFERFGYFIIDKDTQKYGYPVFNRTVTLIQKNIDFEILKKYDKNKIIEILKQYLDNNTKYNKLILYKNKIISYFEDNKINGEYRLLNLAKSPSKPCQHFFKNAQNHANS